jgi:PAS domain S-box-containing protein
MKTQKCNPEDADNLRKKAEDMLNIRKYGRNSDVSEADMLKLIHELEVHQIELELQNEELVEAISKVEMAEERYAELFDFAPLGYLSLATIGTIQNLNFAAARMLGKERSRFINNRFSDFISERTRPVFIQFLKKVFDSKEKQCCEVIIASGYHPTLTEQLLPIDVTIDGILSRNEACCFLTIVDITDRKKAEKALKDSEGKLRESNSEKDKFFSIIAHDLMTPFTSIMGLSEILVEQAQKKDYNEMKRYANIILNSSQHALDLLINLMQWARSQTGRIEFWPEYLQLEETCRETVTLFETIAAQKSITLKNQIHDKFIVYADKAMLSTVCRNLLSNALKFSHPGGEIIISASPKPEELVISVSDKGVGIPKEGIEKLFILSENYSTPGTNKEKGTGLGLILCKDFVEKNGGKIWVESEEGKGSTFYFTLPYNKEAHIGR